MAGNNSFINSSKRTRVINATAAGTTNVNGSVLDMSGFESVIFEACFGTLTAGQVTYLKVQAGNASDGSDAADVAGTKTGPLADTDSNKMLVTEIVRQVPGYRYVRVVVVRGTQNAVIDSVVAIQYQSHKPPETLDDATTVSAKKSIVEPALGTP